MHPIPLPLNAISALVLDHLVKGENDQTLTLTLQRRTPSAVRGISTRKPSRLPDGPPSRLPSTLPPNGSLQLTLSAETVIGDGRCGNVFSTSLSCLADLSAVSSEVLKPGLPYLPELVIKVADSAHVEDLASEASMYDEMESLQGISIPRCYGWFEADLDPKQWTYFSTPLFLENFGQKQPTMKRLSVLLLERVGQLLPLGQRIPDRSDIWAVFIDIARLGIEQPDMRYSNILTAPISASSLPAQPCPYHNCIHNYRIIDFDRARKTDYTLKQHYYEHVGTLGRLLEMMEMNIILEPWEY
ncbi:hypothetical protein BYT27DRAFT_7231974 [Phlegmacium glaucopus]|nr:hypothetical protein BYT27DRAFT_7231974 [Phlegmacium glaucopus]